MAAFIYRVTDSSTRTGPKDVMKNSVERTMTETLETIPGSRGREIVTFNVGGIRFETLRDTFDKTARCHLGNDAFLAKFYNEDRKEFFFDRDPDIFKVVLNYLRTGNLHLPSFICGPAVKAELGFWGVKQNKIEQCCWINYNEWNSTQEALKRLEHDRKLNLQTNDVIRDPNISCWKRTRPRVWQFLNRSNSSFAAKIFGYFSLTVVILSIFSFLAETTEPFEHFETYSTVEKTPVDNIAPIFNKTQTVANLTSLVSNSSFLNADVDNNDVNVTENSNVSSSETEEVRIRSKHPILQTIDTICFVYFAIEYITRLVFSPRKLKYITSLLAVIDLLAILPDLVEFTVFHFRPDLKEDAVAVSYITIIRIIRVLRIFRLVRHSAGLWILVYTLRASVRELMLLIWFMAIGILVFSSLIYYVDDKEVFRSIPTGFWWSLITMTTVGYGDMYPVTVGGKIVGSMCAMAGVLMIGFTVPSLVNNFMLYYRHIQFAMHVDDVEDPDNDETDSTINTEDFRTANGKGEQFRVNGNIAANMTSQFNGNHDVTKGEQFAETDPMI